MGFLHQFEHILTRLPEVQRPRYALSFKERIKWTGFILLAYFFLKVTALYGLDPQAVDIFENMRAIIAGGFGFYYIHDLRRDDFQRDVKIRLFGKVFLLREDMGRRKKGIWQRFFDGYFLAFFS